MQGHLVRYSLASDVKSFCMFFATGQRTVLTCSTFAVELSIWQILARPNEILTEFVFCNCDRGIYMWWSTLGGSLKLQILPQSDYIFLSLCYVEVCCIKADFQWKIEKKLLKLSTFYWRLVFTRNTDTSRTKKDLRFAHLDKFSLNFSSASFVICVTLLLT